jgi:hypothetical protein
VNPREIGALPKAPARGHPDDAALGIDPTTFPTQLAAAADDTFPPSKTVTVESQEDGAAAQAASATTAAPAAPAGKPIGPVGPQGKAPAAFKMKPSKEAKKMDLGEAYLLAQTQKTATLAVQLAAKCRADMIVSLAAGGKTPEEIKLLLVLLIVE